MKQLKVSQQHRAEIEEFVISSGGLNIGCASEGAVEIQQKMDGKKLQLSIDVIDEIIPRTDSVNKPFLQINFVDGQKILLTDNLIGFKPSPLASLDMDQLPRVVTTPDLISVVEAIEESLNSAEGNPGEVEVLKQVFESVLSGGEAIGFNFEYERTWMHRIAMTRNLEPSA